MQSKADLRLSMMSYVLTSACWPAESLLGVCCTSVRVYFTPNCNTTFACNYINIMLQAN